jgi:hypothetical protein
MKRTCPRCSVISAPPGRISVNSRARWPSVQRKTAAKPAHGTTNRFGVPTVREVGYPAEAVALWAGPERCGLFRPDLLHAIMDRLPVIGDWFCYAPPWMSSLSPRNLATGSVPDTNLAPSPSGFVTTPRWHLGKRATTGAPRRHKGCPSERPVSSNLRRLPASRWNGPPTPNRRALWCAPVR